MKVDPCFSCPLPDCDDTSSQCNLRKCAVIVSRKRKNKEHHLISDYERQGDNARYLVWEIERAARLSEARA